MGRADDGGDRWFILRTAAPRTLLVAQKLMDAGYEAWTPVQVQTRRIERGSKKTEKRVVPLAPSFVFVPVRHRSAITSITRLPFSSFPAFSLFRHNGRVPEIAEREIDRLRQACGAKRPAGMKKTYAVGSTYKASQGPYAGMSGVVRSSDGRWTFVAFGGWMDLKIETLSIDADDIGRPQPDEGTAALAEMRV